MNFEKARLLFFGNPTFMFRKGLGLFVEDTCYTIPQSTGEFFDETDWTVSNFLFVRHWLM